MQRKSVNLAIAALAIATLASEAATVHAQNTEAEGKADQVPVQEPEEEGSWTDMISGAAFVDANVVVTSQKSGTAVPGAVYDGAAGHRAYVMNNGFNLNFAGFDLAMNGDQFGGTISMRFGPGVIGFFGDEGAFGISNITQAYVTWMPHEKLTLDLGQFGTIYGAEVLESWYNMNYTRGALYWAMQPFWHVGLRAGVQFTDSFSAKLLVVNGTNNIYEYGKGPSLGLQLAYESDNFSMYAGYLGDVDPKSDFQDPIGAGSLFDHFFDLVVTASAGDFALVLNGDVGFTGEDNGDTMYYGVSAAPGYSFTDTFGAAARVEYLGFPDGENVPTMGPVVDAGGAVMATGSYKSLVTLTGTLDIKPIPDHGNLILRPEFRYEIASDDAFLNRDDEATNGWWLLTLGVVVTTDA